MAYDIFISYRQVGGEYAAKILRDHLQDEGYRVFFAEESQRSGYFNTNIYSVIDECTDFILILSTGSLDRCANEEDWVRREVECALQKGKNIVPIMMRGFTFPDKLPESMDPLRYCHGIEAPPQFFDAVLQQLKDKLLKTKPPIWRRLFQSSIFRRTLPILISAVILLGAGLGVRAVVNSRTSVYPSTNAEINLTDEVIYYVMNNLTNLDMAAGAMETAIQTGQRYLSAGEGDYNSLLDKLAVCHQTIENIDPNNGAPSEGMLDRIVDSPFPMDDVAAMHDSVKSSLNEYKGYLDHLEWLTSPNCYLSAEDKLETLECYQTILEETLLCHAYCCNELLLPVTSDDAMEEFWYSYLPQLTTLPIQVSDWQRDPAVLESNIAQSYNRCEDAILKLTTLVGNMTMENAEIAEQNRQMEEYIIQQYMDKGYSREEAESLMESSIRLAMARRYYSREEAEAYLYSALQSSEEQDTSHPTFNGVG